MNALSHIVAAQCVKCAGSGRFVSYAGRDCGPCFACKGTGDAMAARTGASVANVDKLMSAFEKASQAGLKRPAMRFEGWTASLAPASGKNPGAVYCKARHRLDGSETNAGVYLGKIVAGEFFASRECDAAHKGSIVSTMADPLAAAIAYGRRTGACSCCGRTLSDEKSVSLGIGPVCKKKFGL